MLGDEMENQTAPSATIRPSIHSSVDDPMIDMDLADRAQSFIDGR